MAPFSQCDEVFSDLKRPETRRRERCSSEESNFDLKGAKTIFDLLSNGKSVFLLAFSL